MAFKHKSGRTKNIYLAKKASTAIAAHALVKFDNAGGVTLAVGDTHEALVGVNVGAQVSTDTTTNPIAIQVPLEFFVEWEFDTDSDGGLTDTMVGSFRDLDTLGLNVDASATAKKNILVTKCISTTKGVGVIARGVAYNYVPVLAST